MTTFHIDDSTGILDINKETFINDNLNLRGNMNIDGTFTGDNFNVTSSSNAADVISLITDAGANETIKISNLQGTGTNSISIDSVYGGIAIGPSITNGKELVIGINTLNAKFSPNGTSSTLSLLNSAGTADNSISITASGSNGGNNGGIKLSSVGKLLLDASAAEIGIGTDSNAQPINIGTGGAQRAITIGNSTGNTEITLNAGTSGIDMDTNGEINIATSKDGASAMVLVASSGGIDITATDASAGEDINITATGSSVNITSTEGDASAIKIDASNNSGGIDIDAGTGGITIDTTGNLDIGAETTINDNLNIMGNIDISNGNFTLNTATLNVDTSNNLTLDVSNNIILDADGGKVKFKDSGSEFFLTERGSGTSGNSLFLYSPNTTSDYFKIFVNTNGATTLSTNDSSNSDTEGHLTVDIDGDIILDADTDIKLKSAGTDYLKINKNGDGHCVVTNGVADKNIMFKDAGGNEIMRIDGANESLLIASGKKIEFHDSAEYITSNGTDLSIVSGGALTYTAAAASTWTINGGDLTLDVNSNLVLNSQNIISSSNKFDINTETNINDNLTVLGNTELYNSIFLYDGSKSDDYFSIDIAANGATTIATNDNDGTDANLTLDVDGDIELNASGSDTVFKSNTNFIQRIRKGTTGNALFLYAHTPADSQADYFKIEVAANGATTLQTVDDGGGTDGNLTMTIAGDMTVTPEKNLYLNPSKSLSVTASENITLNFNDELNINGVTNVNDNLNVNGTLDALKIERTVGTATNSITLNNTNFEFKSSGTGNSSIILNQGNLTLSGTGIDLSSSGSVIKNNFAANVNGSIGTLADSATPSVALGNIWQTGGTTTITNFTGGVTGQIINVLSLHSITFDVTSSNLKGGSADITTASGDVTSWIYNGTNWYLLQFMDVSADMSSVSGSGAALQSGTTANSIVTVVNESTLKENASFKFNSSANPKLLELGDGSSAHSFKIHSSNSTSSSFSIDVGANGLTTLTTTDNSGADANLILNIDGSTTLTSAGDVNINSELNINDNLNVYGNVDAQGGATISGGALTITNQAITQTSGGQVTFAGNVDANSGLAVSGGALTIDGQAITQTSGGNVTFTGAVSANAGLGVIGNVTVNNNGNITQIGSGTFSTGTGQVTLNGDVKVGSSAGNGKDVYLYNSGSSDHVGIHWDPDGNTEGTLYGGVDDHGVDFKFYGETSGKFVHWDMSADELILGSSTKLSFHDGAGGENIYASSDGVLVFNAGSTIDINSSTIDITCTTVDINPGAGGFIVDTTSNGFFSIDSTSTSYSSNLTHVGSSSGGADLNVQCTDGSLNLTGGEPDFAAVKIHASNSSGGIVIDSGTGGFIVDTTGYFSIDSTSTSAVSNLTHTGGINYDLNVQCTSGSLNLTGGEADAAAVRIQANNTAGGIDIDAGTGGITIDTTGIFVLTSNQYLDINSETNVNDDLNIYGNAKLYTDLFLYPSNTNDYFSISTADNGATTITTNDNDGTSGNLTLDIDGFITLNSDGGRIYFKDDTASISTLTSSANLGNSYNKLTIYPPSTTSDGLNILVAANGVTTIQTFDNDGTDGNIILDADGDIELNADGGNITMKDDSSTLFGFESDYINFNSSDGESGYGFRNNSGTLQFKNSSGSWTTFNSGGGGGGGGDASTSSSNTFIEQQIISKDTDGEFVALKLINQSDAANTTGIVSLEFDLEDTGGNAVDAGKIAVKKNQSFTATGSTQDSLMVFSTSNNGTLTEHMTLKNDGILDLYTTNVNRIELAADIVMPYFDTSDTSKYYKPVGNILMQGLNGGAYNTTYNSGALSGSNIDIKGGNGGNTVDSGSGQYASSGGSISLACGNGGNNLRNSSFGSSATLYGEPGFITGETLTISGGGGGSGASLYASYMSNFENLNFLSAVGVLKGGSSYVDSSVYTLTGDVSGATVDAKFTVSSGVISGVMLLGANNTSVTGNYTVTDEAGSSVTLSIGFSTSVGVNSYITSINTLSGSNNDILDNKIYIVSATNLVGTQRVVFLKSSSSATTGSGGSAGSLNLSAGTGGAGSTGSSGGNVFITAGTGGYGSSSNGAGGSVTISTGPAGSGGGSSTDGIFTINTGYNNIIVISPSLESGNVVFYKSLIPASNSLYDLGTSSKRWNYIYTNNSVSVSDIRKKKEITDEYLGLEFINNLKAKSYKYNDTNDDVIHQGIIAQEVSETLEKLNIDEDQFFGINKDENGYYNACYSEFITPLIKAVQELDEKQSKRIIELENTVKTQQNLLNDLMQRIEKLENN